MLQAFPLLPFESLFFVTFSVHCLISATENSHILNMVRDKEDSQLSFLERKVQNNAVYLY